MATLSGRGVGSGRAAPDHVSGTSGVDSSQKEDLANFISMITRDETPFMSSIGKTKATTIFHEWQTDELNAPGNSKIGEGADFSAPRAADINQVLTTDNGDFAVGSRTPIVGPNRTRLGNYTQINGKTIAVSGTRRAIDQAGVADEYAYQLKKRGTEMRRDIEHDLIHGYQISSGSGTRTMGGYQAWINDPATVEGLVGDTVATGLGVAAIGDADPAAVAGSGRFVPILADTSARNALSLTQIDGVMQKIYEEGGKANKIMLSPKLRRDFSDLMVTDSGVRRNIDMDGKLRQSVDVYMSDFGDLMVVPNYIMGLGFGTGNDNTSDSAALIYDSMWFSIATLRPLQEVDVGQLGDSTVGMMVEECTMEVKNPVGCGAIYNLK